MCLIDFSLSTSATPVDERRVETEQTLFASIAAHDGRRTWAADNVESLVYSLAYRAAGRLPLQNKRHERAAFMKRRMVTDDCAPTAVQQRW